MNDHLMTEWVIWRADFWSSDLQFGVFVWAEAEAEAEVEAEAGAEAEAEAEA